MDVNDGIKVFAFGMAILLTVILNGVILVTILIEKRPRFSTRCIHVLVTNLAVCQFLIGILVMPFVEVSVLHDSWKNSKALCQVHSFFKNQQIDVQAGCSYFFIENLRQDC